MKIEIEVTQDEIHTLLQHAHLRNGTPQTFDPPWLSLRKMIEDQAGTALLEGIGAMETELDGAGDWEVTQAYGWASQQLKRFKRLRN